MNEQRLTVKNETIRGRSCFVTRDDHYRVVKLSMPVRGGWEEYEGDSAQRKYDALMSPYRMAAYND